MDNQQTFKINLMGNDAVAMPSPFAAANSIDTRPSVFPPVPTSINLGSGKDYRADYFNIDIDDAWAPDAILDLSAVDLEQQQISLPTARFGDVVLRPGYFEKIITNDVLEHVPNLMAFMTTCLQLLKVGGIFENSVPYDLSYGAWQDPTHVRAFNERSWLYYTDWFWYMGWGESRFVLDALNFAPSPLGQELLQKGVNLEDVKRTPRAIDSMSARLRKIELTNQDRLTWQHWRARRDEAAKRNAGRRNVTPANGLIMTASGGATSGATVLPIGRETSPAVQNHAVVAPMPFQQQAPANPLSNPFPHGWEHHRDHHCIWVVSPEGYTHHNAFNEVAATLSEAFIELGGSAPLVRQPSAWQGRAPIVFGANLLPPGVAASLPADTIIVNLEQVQQGSAWMSAEYIALLNKFPVLDYSVRNREALAAHGVSHANLLKIGYSLSLTKVAQNPVKDIDVLFYGSLNERRHRVLETLRQRGLNVVHLFGAYGPERDAAIGRAKIVLNMHFYEAAIFEVVRVSYLLANGACVVTEGDADDVDMLPFADGLAIAKLDDLADRCAQLLADDRLRVTTALRGFKAMSSRWQSDLLKPFFEKSNH